MKTSREIYPLSIALLVVNIWPGFPAILPPTRGAYDINAFLLDLALTLWLLVVTTILCTLNNLLVVKKLTIHSHFVSTAVGFTNSAIGIFLAASSVGFVIPYVAVFILHSYPPEGFQIRAHGLWIIEAILLATWVVFHFLTNLSIPWTRLQQFAHRPQLKIIRGLILISMCVYAAAFHRAHSENSLSFVRYRYVGPEVWHSAVVRFKIASEKPSEVFLEAKTYHPYHRVLVPWIGPTTASTIYTSSMPDYTRILSIIDYDTSIVRFERRRDYFLILPKRTGLTPVRLYVRTKPDSALQTIFLIMTSRGKDFDVSVEPSFF